MSSGSAVSAKTPEGLICKGWATLPRRDPTPKFAYYASDCRIVGRNPGCLFGILKCRSGISCFAAKADNRHNNVAVLRMPHETSLQVGKRLGLTPGRMQRYAICIGISRIIRVKLSSAA